MVASNIDTVYADLFIVLPREMTAVLGLAASEKSNSVNCMLAIEEDTKLMFPDDPFHSHGPNVDSLLRKELILPEEKKKTCIYGKKSSYKHQFKYCHAQRGNQPQ